MKTLLATAIILVLVFSIFAQGQIQVVECSTEMQESFFQTLPMDALLSTGTMCGESSSAVEMVETASIGGQYTPTQFSYIPSSPDMPMQSNQAGIQPVPEPSAFALGGLALGLIGAARLRRRLCC